MKERKSKRKEKNNRYMFFHFLYRDSWFYIVFDRLQEERN